MKFGKSCCMRSGLFARSAEPSSLMRRVGSMLLDPNWPGYTDPESEPGPVMVLPGTGIAPDCLVGSPPC